MNSKFTNTKSVDSMGSVDRKNLLLLRLKGNDLGTDSNSISQVLKDPSSSIGINDHKIFSESAPDLNTSSMHKFSPTDDSIRRGNNYEVKIREEVEKEIKEEYQDKLERIKKFNLDLVREYSFVHQEIKMIGINRKQERLGTITTYISGKAKWSGGVEVMRTENDIDDLTRKLEVIKKPGHSKFDMIAQKRNTIQNALKEKKGKQKQLEEERQDFAIELRHCNDAFQSSFKINQLVGEGKYSLVEFIGIGGFSEVWRGYDIEKCRSVAIKIQPMNPQWSEQIKDNFVKHLAREIQILSSTQHKNVVGFYDKFYIGNNTIAIVMEYCNGGDLAMMLRRRGRISEKEAIYILAQVINGLLSLRLQENYVIHYDLKPANILFAEDEIVKITDFGISKIVEGDASSIELTSQGQGSFIYAAPETFQRGKSVYITRSVDTWSLGIIFYEMLYGSPHPFNEDGKINFISNIKVSEEGKNFIIKCLEKEPTKRPELSVLADDGYIHSILTELNS